MTVVALDLLWMGIYIAAIALISFYTSREKFTFKGYTIGDKRYSNSTMVATIAATILGGNSILGVTESIYRFGAIFLVTIIGGLTSQIFIAKVIAPKIAKHSHAITAGDIMYPHYGKHGRIITGFFAVLGSATILAMQISALSYAFRYVGNIDHKYGVIFSSLIVMLYATMGGIKSVTYTDVLQFILLITIIPILATGALNGTDEKKINLILESDDNFRYLSFFLICCLPSVKPSLIQRFLMSENPKQASKTMLISTLVQIPFYIFIYLIAVAAKYYHHNAEPSQVFFLLMDTVLPIGTKWLVVVALLSIIMSTADSELNVASTTFIKDCVEPMRKAKIRDSTKVLLAKLSTVIIGVIAIVIAMNFQSIMAIFIAGKHVWTPVISIPFLAAVFGYAVDKKLFIGLILLFSADVALYSALNLKEYTGFDAVFPCAVLNTIMFIIVYMVSNKISLYNIKQSILSYRKV